MTILTVIRAYQWEEPCPHAQYGSHSIQFVELTVECVNSETRERLSIKEILYDHPLKVTVFNRHELFDLVHSADYRKYYPGIKCQHCDAPVEDFLVHERFITRFHANKKWNQELLDACLVLEEPLPKEHAAELDCL